MERTKATTKRTNVLAAAAAVVVLGLGSGVIGAATAAEAPPKAKPEARPDPDVAPEAVEALRRMTTYLRVLPAFAVLEDIVREQVINEDLKVHKASVADVVMRRPDRLRISVSGDDGLNHAIFYDGKTLSVHLPARKYYAQAKAPEAIAETIALAEKSYGVEFPARDLLQAAAEADFASDLTAAGNVGPSRVGGADCNHYAYRTPEIDFQFWIERGDRPLPRKLVITSKKLPGQPEYVAVFSWNLAPRVDDAVFAFKPPPGTIKIPFRVPEATAAAPKKKGK